MNNDVYGDLIITKNCRRCTTEKAKCCGDITTSAKTMKDCSGETKTW